MKKSVLFISTLLFLTTTLYAQKSPVYIDGNVAIKGYDPVAYFTAHKPVKGNKDLSFRLNETTWYFSSKSNLDSFKNSPQKFIPQFGGYCAFGMADGHKAPTDPNAWAIVHDKLYLNYNKDVQAMWKEKQDAYIETAEKNWLLLKDKE